MSKAKAPAQKSWSQRLPKAAWAVLDTDHERLAMWDYRVPVFWLRKIAAEHNRERLNGEGKIVRVVINRIWENGR